MIGSRVSKRYAKALLSIGQEDGRLQQYGQELSDFAEFCRHHPELLKAVSSRIFPQENRKRILNGILEKSHYSEIMVRFLNLLLDKDRIGAVEAITLYYERLTDEASNIARAEVITPRPLKEEARKRLEVVLAELMSKKVKMEIREDESLIGGIIVKVGDLVLDGSIRAQLAGLKESLKRGEYS
ncbi:MAG: ATP synthase F1 subunit delta [Deltaproteobacteria bacterium]